MEHLAITKFTYLASVSEESIKNDDTYEKIVDEIAKAIEPLAKKYGLERESIETLFINQQKFSIGRCEKCQTWTMDRIANPVKDEGEEPIRDGATHDGKLLCYQCLPKNHRWAW
ncbi:hypothetical protein BGP_1254 [Beggiatoa sp. PS]|nr:hypothetical protein BGP_1254 [Beggiatoa sp. PS]